MNKFDLIVKSPGINNNTKLMNQLDKKKILSDLELFYRINRKLNYIVVTGSNGKTTVTSLIESVLKSCSFVACGNIGKPIFDYIYENLNGLIVEASSYMLEYIYNFKPNIFILLNIEKHHLEHHLTFENYYMSKFKPLKNMLENDIVIYNLDDSIIKEELKKYNLKKYSFSMIDKNANCYYEEGIIYYENKVFMNLEDLSLIGEHNIKNIMTTILTCKKSCPNLKDELIINRIKCFQPLKHRLEIFFENSNTIFINDSKSTNPFSTIEAIKTISKKYSDKKIILIMGGKKENFDYSILNQYLVSIDRLYLYGECAKKISKETKIDNQIFPNIENIIRISDFTDRVVLFSPGAPSFDQFKNYEDRGEIFKNLVIEKYKKTI